MLFARNTILICLIASVTAIAAERALAIGNSSGGGGKGVVCRASDNSVLSVELLDLWEARTLRALKLEKSSGDLATDVDKALQSLEYAYDSGHVDFFDGKQLCKFNECLLREMRQTGAKFLADDKSVVRLHGVKLEPTSDAFELAEPSDCGIEQIVNYQPSGGVVLLNEDLFEKMDMLNQAALIAHEAFYASLRDQDQEANSLRVRRAIGDVFSGVIFALPPPVSKSPKFISCLSIERDNESQPFTQFDISLDYEKITFASVAGQVPVGLTTNSVASIVGLPESLKRLLQSGPCKSDATWGDSGHLPGSVEFDREFNLDQRCKAGRTSLEFAVRSQGEQSPTVYHMVCHESHSAYQL